MEELGALTNTETEKTEKLTRLNLVGEVYGRLTVLALDHIDPDGHTIWRVRCSCPAATEKTVRANALRTGGTQSCGCLAREIAEAKKQQPKKERHRVEPQAEGSEPRDILDFWVMCWRRLNSEDENIVEQTRLNVRKHFEKIANANAKAREEMNGVGSENGLADDVADEF